MVLLVGAGLMISSILRLQRVKPGIDTSNVLSMDFQLAEGGKYVQRVPGGDMERVMPPVTAFYQRLIEKVSTLPGVESAGLVGALPARCCNEQWTFAILGHPAPAPEDRPQSGYSEASAGFFATLKIPLIKGRYLDEHDTLSAPWAIVVNQTFVHKYFPNEDPIGHKSCCDSILTRWTTRDRGRSWGWWGTSSTSAWDSRLLRLFMRRTCNSRRFFRVERRGRTFITRWCCG
jgi:putative ABC transport system permease protein